MKNHRIILLLLCLFMANSLFAETNEQSLVVLMKSGTMVALPVSEQPKITFNGTVMRVGNGDYQIENVRKWMVGNAEEIANGMQAPLKDKSVISYKNDILSVGNQTGVRVFNLEGMEIPVNLKNGQVDMSAWPRAIYVIKVGTETLKIRKR